MKDIYNEEWRAIKGFEGLYAVSDMGRVKSVERTVTFKDGRKRHYKEHILETYLGGVKGNQYLQVDLYKNGKRKKCRVHRLVALTFIPNPCPEKYDVVNHKIEGAEGRLINTVENLEWCDTAYNNNYGTCNERKAKTQTNGKCSKAVYQYNTAHELVKEWESTHEVQRQMGWSSGNISQCCNNSYNPNGTGAHNVYKGFIWSYEPLTV